MPSVIDSLIVELNLDPRQFTEGQKAALESFKKTKEGAESFARDIEGTGKKLGDIFSTVKRGAVGILAGFIGGEAASFVDKIAVMDAYTKRMARTMGESTHELSVWQNQIRSVGGTAEDVTSSFSGLNNAFMNFAMNQALPSPWFAQLMNRASINPFSMPTPHEALMKLLPVVARERDPRMQAFDINQFPDLTAKMRLFLLELVRTPERMKNLREEIEKIGVASDKSGDEAIELQIQTAKLDAAFENLARVGFPALTFIVNRLAEILGFFGSSNRGEQGDTKITGPERSFWNWYNKMMGKPPLESGSMGAARRDLAEGMRGPGRATTAEPRGDRNNNPGNIEYGPFASAHGATGTDGRFAVFPDWNTGANAMAALLRQRYQGMTLSGIQQRWTGAPSAAYLGGMSAETGLRPGEVPNINDPAVMKKLMRGMIHGEGSHIPLPAGGGVSNKTSNFTIGTMNVTSNKADPKAVADEIPDSIKRWAMLTGANTGLT